MQTEPILIMSDEFSKNYTFLENYENTVIHIETEQIFQVEYEHGMMRLYHVSNRVAMEKLEEGMLEINKKLKKDLGLD